MATWLASHGFHRTLHTLVLARTIATQSSSRVLHTFAVQSSEPDTSSDGSPAGARQKSTDQMRQSWPSISATCGRRGEARQACHKCGLCPCRTSCHTTGSPQLAARAPCPTPHTPSPHSIPTLPRAPTHPPTALTSHTRARLRRPVLL
eukprot:361871-Chlamydomonas_euryale.AAC.23